MKNFYIPGNMYHIYHEKLGVIYALLIRNDNGEYIWITRFGDFVEDACGNSLIMRTVQPLPQGKILVTSLPADGWEIGWIYQNNSIVNSGAIQGKDGSYV